MHGPDHYFVTRRPRPRLLPQRGTLNVDKARSLLGYQPQYPIEVGIPRYIEWYRSIRPQVVTRPVRAGGHDRSVIRFMTTTTTSELTVPGSSPIRGFPAGSSAKHGARTASHWLAMARPSDLIPPGDGAAFAWGRVPLEATGESAEPRRDGSMYLCRLSTGRSLGDADLPVADTLRCPRRSVACSCGRPLTLDRTGRGRNRTQRVYAVAVPSGSMTSSATPTPSRRRGPTRSFCDERGSAMSVAEIDGRVVGFLMTVQPDRADDGRRPRCRRRELPVDAAIAALLTSHARSRPRRNRDACCRNTAGEPRGGPGVSSDGLPTRRAQRTRCTIHRQSGAVDGRNRESAA